MKKTFKFKKKTYTIVKKNGGKKSEWEEKITDVTRERVIFAWRPWWIGKKFRWLKKITVKESLRFVRYVGFDDGYNYTLYWEPWEKKWEVIEILS